MADWSDTNPQETTPYTQVLPALRDRDKDAYMMAESPTNPPTGAIRFVRASNKFQEWDGAAWQDRLISIAGGGTAAATAADARTNLGLGTMAIQNNNSVTITGGTISGLTSIGAATAALGNVTVSGTLGVTGLSNLDGNLSISNASPQIIIDESDQAANERKYLLVAQGKTVALQAVTDALGSPVNIWIGRRGAGTAITSLETTTDFLVTTNTKGFYLTNQVGTSISLATINVSNELIIGSDVSASMNDTVVRAGQGFRFVRNSGTLIGDLRAAGFVIPNTAGFFVENTAGSDIPVGQINSSNEIIFGSSNGASVTNTYLRGGASIRFDIDGAQRFIISNVGNATLTGTLTAAGFTTSGNVTAVDVNATNLVASVGVSASNASITNGISCTDLTASLGVTGANLSISSSNVNLTGLGTGAGTDLIITAGNVVQRKSSSIRYKENIGDFKLDIRHFMSSLVPVRFDYINSAKNLRGFIAEEVYTNYPELVNVNEDQNPESLRLDGLVTYMYYTIRVMYDRLSHIDRYLFGASSSLD